MDIHDGQAELSCRSQGLGRLSILPDYLISYITFGLDIESVLVLSCASRVCRVFASEEPLWMHLAMQQYRGKLSYKGSWRKTALCWWREGKTPEEDIERAMRPVPSLLGFESLFLYKRWYRCHVDLRDFFPPAQHIPTVCYEDISVEVFSSLFEGQCQPVMVSGVTASWPVDSWSLPNLLAKYSAATFTASKPSGGKIPVRLDDFLAYMSTQHDEDPLYIFDQDFGTTCPELLQQYQVPPFIPQDYYKVLGSRRPPYQWLVLGPGRSGAAWHVDPSLTSAWNTLLSGCKRWALYPPDVVPPGVVADTMMGSDEHEVDMEDEYDFDSLTPLQWYLEVYPGLREEDKPWEVLQRPGDTVIVPGGWWHCVLNLETSVAVTQNYVSDANLDRVICYEGRGGARYFNHPTDYYDPEVVNSWRKRDCDGEDSEDTEADGEVEDTNSHRSTSQGSDREVDGLCQHGSVESTSAVQPAHGGVMLVSCQEQQDGSYLVWMRSSGTLSSQDGVCSMVLKGEGLGASSSDLGRWLKALCQQEPQLTPRILEICRTHLGMRRLEGVIEALALAHPHLPLAHCAMHCLPLCGASSAVFILQELAIKVFMDKDLVLTWLMARAEAYMYNISRGGDSLWGCLPECSLRGLLAYEYDAHRPPICVPYLIVSKVEGNGMLRDVWPQLSLEEKHEVAGHLGSILAAIHHLPGPAGHSPLEAWPGGLNKVEGAYGDLNYPSASSWPSCHASRPVAHGVDPLGRAAAGESREEGSSELVNQEGPGPCASLEVLEKLVEVRQLVNQILCGYFWHNQEGRIWHITHDPMAGGCEGGGALDGPDEPEATVLKCTAGVVLKEHPQAETLSPSQSGLPCPSLLKVPPPWWPFLAFLTKRRAEVLEEYRNDVTLPCWAREQIDGYLPQTPVDLVKHCCEPFETWMTQPWQSPSWLHGDLMADNVVVDKGGALAATQKQRARTTGCAAGVPHGADLLMTCTSRQGLELHVIDFGDAGYGDPLYDLVALFVSCLECEEELMRSCWSAYLSWTGRQGTPQVVRHMSYCLMCYILLHEEDALSKVLAVRPDLAAVGSLQNMEEQLLGFMNE